MPMERRVPSHYQDGVYDLSGYDRPNVLVISNLTFEGLTGRGSDTRTALFTFYGKTPTILFSMLKIPTINKVSKL